MAAVWGEPPPTCTEGDADGEGDLVCGDGVVEDDAEGEGEGERDGYPNNDCTASLSSTEYSKHSVLAPQMHKSVKSHALLAGGTCHIVAPDAGSNAYTTPSDNDNTYKVPSAPMTGVKSR